MLDSDRDAAIQMIRESARGITGEGSLRRARALRYTVPGFDREVWHQMCEMGWPALRLPEDRGGIGLGLSEYCALAEELGRGLVPEPLIPAVLASALLEGEVLERHLSGETLVLPAVLDPVLSPGMDVPLRTGAVASHVPMGAGADALLVIGRTATRLLAPDAVDLAIRQTQDGGTLAVVTVGQHVEPTPANTVDPLAEASLATAAYLLGLMEAALEMTVAYLKTRSQFGQTIGHFQVLQHMAVDLRLEVELTRATVEDAARRWDCEGSTPASRAAIARSRVRAGQAALKVTREAVQLHGGIGFTDEHDIGLFLRRAIVIANQFGTVPQHRALHRALKPVRETA